jgi:hypothetical protein
MATDKDDDEQPSAETDDGKPTKRQAAEAWSCDVQNPRNRLKSTGGEMWIGEDEE